MSHYLVFEVDRGDPLAAGLDDVLRAVGDLGVTAFVHRADVAGAQPAVVEALGRGILIIRCGDPRAAHLDLADRSAVPWQLVALIVGEPHLDSGKGAAGLRAPLGLLGFTRAARR